MTLNLKKRLLLVSCPIVCGLCLPSLVAFWVFSDSEKGRWSQVLANILGGRVRIVDEDLLLPTLLHLPPFIILAIICSLARASERSLVRLLLFGLVLISVIQVPIMSRMFKRMQEGEAEFVAAVWLTNALMSTAFLAIGMFIVWGVNSYRSRSGATSKV